MTPTPTQLASWRARQYSWSQHSSFEYDPAQWYDRYILGNSTPSTPTLEFGKKLADSIEWGAPLAPFTIYPKVEYGITAEIDGLKVVGYLDSWWPEELKLAEYKSGKLWTQKKVDNHHQLTFYAMLLYLAEQIRPEDIHMILEWVPTGMRPDFTFGFIEPAAIHQFETRRTMTDVLQLAVDIKQRRKDMEAYIASRK